MTITLLRHYPKQAERVRNRWGPEKLLNQGHLWYYAEFDPEHLNEVGAAVLED